jgi:CBS domain containing-hemolysin-like protein
LRGGAFEADGRASVSEVERVLGTSLALQDDEGEYDTAGGLAVVLAGRVPQRGEVLRHPAGFDFEVVDADPRRVKRLRIKPAPPPPPSEAAA